MKDNKNCLYCNNKLNSNNIVGYCKKCSRKKVKFCKCGVTILPESKTCKICSIVSGEQHHFYGKTHTNETIIKMKKNHINLSGTRSPFYGKKHSTETKEKNRMAHIGKVHSDKTKAKISKANKDKKCSNQTKVKMSESAKQKPPVSDETKKKMSENRANIFSQNNPRYIDGRSFWIREVKERDNYTCQVCGKNKTCLGFRQLHAHHIKSKKQHPELMYDLDNGITLCNRCHKTYENKPQLLETKRTEYVRKQS
jgi:5-methylcytosine-specific restriction endonuclease McrA